MQDVGSNPTQSLFILWPTLTHIGTTSYTRSPRCIADLFSIYWWWHDFTDSRWLTAIIASRACTREKESRAPPTQPTGIVSAEPPNQWSKRASTSLTSSVRGWIAFFSAASYFGTFVSYGRGCLIPSPAVEVASLWNIPVQVLPVDHSVSRRSSSPWVQPCVTVKLCARCLNWCWLPENPELYWWSWRKSN